MGVVGVSNVQGRVPVTVFQLHDRINMGNASELVQAARLAYDQGMRCLLIDLTQAPSTTSAGLRALLTIYHLLEGGEKGEAQSDGSGKSQRLKLFNPSAEVRRTLQISGFERYFDSYFDIEKAVASF